MNNEMKKVDIWLQANGLVINLEKTHFMVFHRARIKTNSSKISIRDSEISRVFSTKFLGIIIDDQLKWLEHIQYIKNKVSKSVGILCKVQKYLDQQTLHNLYYTFVYPYLIYGVEIWGNACNVYLDPLVKLQKKCLRIITFSSYLEHTEPLFHNLEILNFKQLVIHRIAMLMFKNSKEMVPIAIRMLFARNDQYHNYNTRPSRSLHPSVGKGEAIYRSFSFHGVNIWNYLSKHIPTNVSYNHFNKLTKSYVLNNDIIYRLV